jgi:hypothetical protein
MLVLSCACVVLQAQRAEVDSGVLLEELQALIQAKADVAQQRADLDRCACSSIYINTIRVRILSYLCSMQRQQKEHVCLSGLFSLHTVSGTCSAQRLTSHLAPAT